MESVTQEVVVKEQMVPRSISLSPALLIFALFLVSLEQIGYDVLGRELNDLSFSHGQSAWW